MLVLKAILAACEDAGVSPREIDGFCSYSNDRNTPARLANALGLSELRYSNMQWGGGGGGAAAVVQNAASAVHAARPTWWWPTGPGPGAVRPLRTGGRRPAVRGEFAYTLPYGVMSPAQMYAMRTPG